MSSIRKPFRMPDLKLHYNGHEIDQRKDAVELFGGTETKYFAMTADLLLNSSKLLNISKQAALLDYANIHGFDISALTGSWLSEEEKAECSFFGLFEIFQQDRKNGKHGGVHSLLSVNHLDVSSAGNFGCCFVLKTSHSVVLGIDVNLPLL